MIVFNLGSSANPLMEFLKVAGPIVGVILAYLFNRALVTRQRSFDFRKSRVDERRKLLSEIIVSMRRVKQLAFRASEDHARMAIAAEAQARQNWMRDLPRGASDEEIKARQLAAAQEVSIYREQWFASRKLLEDEIEKACIAAEVYGDMPSHVASRERRLGVLLDEWGESLIRKIRRDESNDLEIRKLAVEPLAFVRVLQEEEDRLLHTKGKPPRIKFAKLPVVSSMPSLVDPDAPQPLPAAKKKP